MRPALVLLVAAMALGCKSGQESEPSKKSPAPAPASAVSAPTDAAAKVKPKPRRAMLDSIAILPDHPSKRKLEIYPERLAKVLGKELTDTDWFGAETRPLPAGVEGRKATIRVRIKYDYELDKRTSILVTLTAVDAEVIWEDGGGDMRPREKVLLKRTMTKKQRTMDVAEHVAEQIAAAVMLAGKGLVEKAKLLEADRDRLLIVMGKLDDDIVMWALAVAGQRKIQSLFDTVVGLLKSKHRNVREAAVGCLIELGDRRAVPHLTKLVKFRDHRLLIIVIDAVASLGGQEAVEFLDFLKSGHGTSEVRDAASQALKRMQRTVAKP